MLAAISLTSCDAFRELIAFFSTMPFHFLSFFLNRPIMFRGNIKNNKSQSLYKIYLHDMTHSSWKSQEPIKNAGNPTDNEVRNTNKFTFNEDWKHSNQSVKIHFMHILFAS